MLPKGQPQAEQVAGRTRYLADQAATLRWADHRRSQEAQQYEQEREHTHAAVEHTALGAAAANTDELHTEAGSDTAAAEQRIRTARALPKAIAADTDHTRVLDRTDTDVRTGMVRLVQEPDCTGCTGRTMVRLAHRPAPHTAAAVNTVPHMAQPVAVALWAAEARRTSLEAPGAEEALAA